MSVGANRLVGLALLTTLCALAVASIATAATPAAVRACVERGLTRYTGPADAVAAQYADLETACIAALDASEVSVEFSSGDDRARPVPGAEGSGEGVARSPGTSGSSGEPPDRGAAAPEEPAGQPRRAPSSSRAGSSDDATSATTVATLVRQSVSGGRASSGTPLPRALNDIPGWLLALVGGSVALIGSGIVVGLRKRPR